MTEQQLAAPDDVARPAPLDTETPAVRVTGLTKRYGDVVAVDSLGLVVPSGSIFGLVGPNGAGKTTTMLAIVTLLVPDAGTVEVHGIDAADDPRAIRRLVGYMPDFFGVYEGITCDEYLGYFAAAQGLEDDQATGEVDDLLELVGLEHKRDADIAELSRGMQQRLSLARALVHDPKVLVLDEPASGLDPRARVALREILLLLAEMGHTIVLSSHILAELEQVCDHVAIIEQGRVLASGTPEAIRQGVPSEMVVRVRLHPGAADRIDEVAATAARLGGVHEATRNGAVRLRLPGGEDEVVTLLRELVRADLPVVDFREEAGGLERLFMDVTKGAAE